jgi:hypothetical protein
MANVLDPADTVTDRASWIPKRFERIASGTTKLARERGAFEGESP